MSVPVALLDEATLADVALETLDGLVTPYVILYIAKLLHAVSTLTTDQHLSFPASFRINNGVPYEVRL